jgi:hypothetical protein
MKDNQHVQAIPSTALTQAQTKIDEARALLTPYLLALTPAERRELPKMGEKPIGFVEKAYDFARQNPGLVPPYLEIDAFGVDFADAHGLWTLLNAVQQLEEAIDDTEMTAGSVATVGSARIRPRSCSTSPSRWRRRKMSPARRRSTRN